jgi:endonuclease YncB( thermonuclease family)
MRAGKKRKARRRARNDERVRESGRASALKRGATIVLAGLGAFVVTAALLNLAALRAPQLPAAAISLPAQAVDADDAFVVVPAAGPTVGTFRVVDGDTLALAGRRIRLFGIDAPESAQSCTNASGRYACGQRATEALVALIGEHAVTCVTVGRDRYQRDIARCRRDDGLDLNGEMVLEGWAIAYRRFALDYVAQEDTAHAAGRGIWAGAFDPPEVWRAAARR